MKYKNVARGLWHVVAWGAVALVIYSEPIGAWMDEHHPIGGNR